jgi:anti-sigma factor RsiW
MTDKPTEQELNAYVDGELSPQDVARVARWIARDARIASRIATLTRLKSAMSELAQKPAKPILLPRPRLSLGLAALAASFALLVAVSAAILTGITPLGSNDIAWFEEARQEHTAWAVDPADPNAREVEANLHLANLERVAVTFQSPDLTSAKLRLTYEHFYQASRTAPPALHLGYTGRRGCKVTLWVTSAPESLSQKLTEIRQDKMRGFRWRVGRTAYAMFATGMEEQRFTVIANKVYESTRKNRGFDDGTRVALNKASTGVPPCQA